MDKYQQKLAYNAEYSKTHRETINANVRRKRAEKKQILIDRLGGVCVGCGTTHNLQFDHKDASTKAFNITKKLDTKWEIVTAEADKCQLMCKECHKIKTRAHSDRHTTLKGYTLSQVINEGDTITITYVKDTTTHK